jgi:hypothetical protein
MHWTYDRYQKLWTGSRGTGRFGVQKGARAWYTMAMPFAGNPVVLGTFASKGEAMASAERIATPAQGAR